MSRQRRRGPPRCQSCNAPVVFFKSPNTGNWRPFDPRPVDHRQQLPMPAYPVENNVWAWPYRSLVEDLRVRLGCSTEEADEHARAMPWHLPHNCPNRPKDED